MWNHHPPPLHSSKFESPCFLVLILQDNQLNAILLRTFRAKAVAESVYQPRRQKSWKRTRSGEKLEPKKNKRKEIFMSRFFSFPLLLWEYFVASHRSRRESTFSRNIWSHVTYFYQNTAFPWIIVVLLLRALLSEVFIVPSSTLPPSYFYLLDVEINVAGEHECVEMRIITFSTNALFSSVPNSLISTYSNNQFYSI